MCFFFYIFDGWSVVKLTGLCGWSWVALWSSVGGLGSLSGPPWAVLGRCQGLSGRSWANLGASVDGSGLLSGPLWTVLGCSQGLCGRSWAALRASVGDLGLLSGPLWAVLGRCQGLCGRSWGGIKPKVAQTRAGRGSGKGIRVEKWPKPKRERDQQRVGPAEGPEGPEAPYRFFIYI